MEWAEPENSHMNITDRCRIQLSHVLAWGALVANENPRQHVAKVSANSQ